MRWPIWRVDRHDRESKRAGDRRQPGIGRAIALRIARDGFDVVVHCRSRLDEAQAVMAEIHALGQQARVLMFDVADREAARAVLEADVEAHGAYYGVVCNAGIARDGAFPALSAEDWDQVIHTNLDGFYNVLHPLIMPMVRRLAASSPCRRCPDWPATAGRSIQPPRPAS